MPLVIKFIPLGVDTHTHTHIRTCQSQHEGDLKKPSVHWHMTGTHLD